MHTFPKLVRPGLLLSLAGVLLCALAASGPARGEAAVVATVPVGSWAMGAGFNPATNRAYVSAHNGGSLTAINGTTGAVLANVAVGYSAEGVGVNPVTNRIYVPLFYNSTVTVVNGATHAIIGSVPVGQGCTGVGVNTNTNRVYVSNRLDDTLTIIDGAAGAVITTLRVGREPAGVAVNAATNRVYVCNWTDGTLSVVDGATNTLTGTIPIGGMPYGVAVNRTTNRVYVSSAEDDTLSVVDAAAGTVTAVIPVGYEPYGVAVNESVDRVYVTGRRTTELTVVDGATNTVSGSVTVGNAPTAVAVNPATGYLVVANLDETATLISDAPPHLAFLTQPSNTTGGAAITPAVRVAVQDGLGHTVITATDSITLALAANPRAGTLAGTTTVRAVNGVATFAGLRVDRASSSPYTLAASAAGLEGAVSAPFLVRLGPAAKLGILSQPRTAAAGATLALVRVAVQDAGGNLLTTAANPIALALGANPGRAALAGAVTANPVGGIASFANLSLNRAGVGYTLRAAAAGLASATSAAFNITPGAPAGLAFTVSPANTTGGRAFSPTVRVAVQDALGNTVTTSRAVITVALGADAGTATLSGVRTIAAVNGVAAFVGLSVNLARSAPYTLVASAAGRPQTTSAPFTVGVGPAARLAFTVQPRNAVAGAALAPALRVAVQDLGGNSVATAANPVTLALGANPGRGTLSGGGATAAAAGVATFAGLSVNKVGAGYTVRASAAGLAGASSAPFTIAPAPAARLAFAVQPSSVAAGTPIAPAVRVALFDAFGNAATSSAASVTVAIGTNPAGGILTGTTTARAAAGVATFSNLRVDRSSSAAYTLTASVPGLPGATSTAFIVRPGAPVRLGFLVQPAGATAGAAIAPAVRVGVLDAVGNVVPTATHSITLALATTPAGGRLSGTTIVAAVRGIATFANARVDRAGAGYTLRATAAGLGSGTSAAVAAAAPAGR